ncbi:MAG: hypothetical protein HYZ42_09315 [Bacteroidetes bacterium]|nr:hypothetical protein [Bacteroidota bacterium]
MNIPYMRPSQFAVGKAEFATGIVLNNDGTFYVSGSDLNNMYEILDDYIEAKKLAIDKINNNSNIECWIVDSNGQHLTTYDKNGERK